MDGHDEGLADLPFVEGLWKELLAVDTVRAEDDFYDLGGDSLLAIRLLVAISARMGTELEYEAFFESPSFGMLVKLADAAHAR